jgi:hypothetical protein
MADDVFVINGLISYHWASADATDAPDATNLKNYTLGAASGATENGLIYQVIDGAWVSTGAIMAGLNGTAVSPSEIPRSPIVPKVANVASPVVAIQDSSPAATALYYGLFMINGGDLPSEAYKFANNIDVKPIAIGEPYEIPCDDPITRLTVLVVGDADDKYVTDAPTESELNNTGAQPNLLVYEFEAADNVKLTSLLITQTHILCGGSRYE